ncbi:potassium transporter Kef [Haloterrigena sp. H1]|uniref:cation:proton antiporter n=1 Tax=Haloterrigena sp. H1 TaxID=2552943 RepID=UPI00110EBAB5|nr:cation:proton antiporter [Haloterrigena sp. H1]TMT81411.1 potassium transporter Kef [Haloterrigena sp. H1]
MAEMVATLAMVFVIAGIILLLANQLSISTIPSYILAGIFVGPVVDQLTILELAQWGIAFLVFAFGTRIDFQAIKGVLRDSELAAMAQIAIVGPVGFLVATLFGFDPLNAVYFAAAGTLSSTLVGRELLEQTAGPRLVHDRLASSIHLFDDLVAVVLLLVISADTYTPDAIAANIGYGVILLIVALFIYRYGFDQLVRLADGSAELILMGSISILFAFLAAANFVGLSIVVGAFAAGIAIRRDGTDALEVFNGIQSLRDFFVAIFFVTVGALVSIPTLEVVVISIALIGLVLVVNPFITMLSLLYEGYDARTVHLVGTSTNQVSEMTLILVIEAALIATINEMLFDAIIIAAAATMILISVVRKYEQPLYERAFSNLMQGRQTVKIDRRSNVNETLQDHVIIVGYGRQGRQIVETCEQYDQEYVVIENDPLLWEDVRMTCSNYVRGDALYDYSWTVANASDATLIVSTADYRPTSEQIMSLDIESDVVLRSRSIVQAREWLERGAIYVAVPDLLASDQLIDHVETIVGKSSTTEELREDHLNELGTVDREVSTL